MSPLSQRRFKVINKIAETKDIASFYLQLCDGPAITDFLPGQFLTLLLPIAGQKKPLVRSYSISNFPTAIEPTIRLTIKRETAPIDQTEVADGLGSNYMHDQIHVGSYIEAMGPAGQFHLHEDNNKPAVLLSGGVGITPMLSMLHALSVQPDRPVYFIHACENSEEQAFSLEVQEQCQTHDHLQYHICHRKPLAEDHPDQHYHSQGFINKQILQSILPLDLYAFYLCGPPPFMQAMYKLLRQLGIDPNSIHYEFFGPASLLKEAETEAPKTQEMTKKPQEQTSAPELDEGEGVKVHFARSNITVNWSSKYDNLLDLAEAAGIEAEFSCRIGICNACSCCVKSGEVNYTDEPLDPPSQGETLLCCAQPKNNLVLDL